MKKILSDVPFRVAMLAWVLALAVLLVFTFETVGQTQEVTRYTSAPIPATATNFVTITAVPLADKIDKWFDALQNIIIGAGLVITALLGVWAKIKTTQASVVPVLVKTIAAHGTEELKAEIEQAALRAQVEPALNAAVKGNTQIIVKNPFPLVPVVEPPKTI